MSNGTALGAPRQGRRRTEIKVDNSTRNTRNPQQDTRQWGMDAPQRPRRKDAGKPRRPAAPSFSHDELIASWIGGDVRMELHDGTILEGQLVNADRYALVYVTADGSERVMFKHALAYIEAVDA
jgi:hypothetical protein